MTKPIVKQDLADMFEKWAQTSQCEECRQEYFTENSKHIENSWIQEYSTNHIELNGEFIQLAKVGIQESVESLKKAILEQDIDAINRVGHKLKGISLVVGLTQLSKLAVALELLEMFDQEYVQDLLEDILFEIRIVTEI